ERPPLVGIGAEPDQHANRVDAAVAGGPDQRRAAVRVGVDARSELDQERQRLRPAGLRRPDERLVEDLLRIVRGRPRREAAVRAVELAVGAGRLRSGELADQAQVAETGGDAQVDWLAAEQVDDLAVTPEERADERGAAVAARREV